MAIRIKNRQRSKKFDLPELRKELEAALLLLGHEGAELSILFTGSRAMAELNGRYRGIQRETDVLSFPMAEGSCPVPGIPGLLGDIVISVPKAVSQAAEYGNSFREELRRLLVHGLLHLLGYDHEQGRSRRMRMEKKERELIDALARLG